MEYRIDKARVRWISDRIWLTQGGVDLGSIKLRLDAAGQVIEASYESGHRSLIDGQGPVLIEPTRLPETLERIAEQCGYTFSEEYRWYAR